jgi:hypothetical protein
MGACPEHDVGEDENGNRKFEKHGTDSIHFNQMKYSTFNKKKLCMIRDRAKRTYFDIIKDPLFMDRHLEYYNQQYPEEMRLHNTIVYNEGELKFNFSDAEQ